MIVLAIGGMGQSSGPDSRVGQEIGNRLYASGLFAPPGREAIWADPHYGYLGKCYDPNCAWRSTLLLKVKYSVVGNLTGSGESMTLDLHAVEGETGIHRDLTVHGPHDSLVAIGSQKLAGEILGSDPTWTFGNDSATDACARRVHSLNRLVTWAGRGQRVFGWAGAGFLFYAMAREGDVKNQDRYDHRAAYASSAGFSCVVVAAAFLFWKWHMIDVLPDAKRDLGAKVVSLEPAMGPQAWGVRLDASF